MNKTLTFNLDKDHLVYLGGVAFMLVTSAVYLLLVH